MGMCDPKAIRNGKAWADVVNKTPMNPLPKLCPQTCTIPKTEFLKNQGLATLPQTQE